MNNQDFKRHIAYEVLVILALLSLLLFVCRLWPILLLVILGIFAAAIRLLFLANTKVKAIPPQAPLLLPPGQPAEQPHQADTFSQIQFAVIEQVTASYPEARWVWKTPGARSQLLDHGEARILLNRAGGYREAIVRAADPAAVKLTFCGAPTPPETAPTPSDSEDDTEPAPEVPVNYEYLAFEWVDANVVALNERCNECIAQGRTSLLLEAAELPHRNSWPDLCQELKRNGIEDCCCTDDGIQINLKQ